MSQVSIVVYCKAEPQGSKKGFIVPGKGGAKDRAVVVDDNKVVMRSYRQQVTREAVYELAQRNLPRPMAGEHVPVELILEFVFVRPKSCPKSRVWPVVKPDIDKLKRSTMDALKGVLYLDDAQVVWGSQRKVYGPIEQVNISARIIKETP